MNVTDILITNLTVWSIWFEEHIGSILFIITMMAVTIATARLLDGLLEKYFIKVALKIKVDPTEYRLLRHFIVFSIYTIGIIIIIFSIPQLHSLSVALLASAGVAGIIIGLAAQTTIGNIISGVSLAVSHPFRVGDLVTIHNEYGTISDLTLRHTVMTTWDNRRLIIPNLIVNDLDIINWSIEDPIVIWPIDIAISYDSDIDLARSIMISEAVKHPMVMDDYEVNRYNTRFMKGVMEGEQIKVRVSELGDFGVNLKLYVLIHDRNEAYSTGCDLMESIKKRFDAEGIEIPYPYRTVVFKKDQMPNARIKDDIRIKPNHSDNFHLQETQEQPDE